MRDKDSGKKIFWIYPTNKFVWAGVVICSIFCAFMIYFLCVANLSENKGFFVKFGGTSSIVNKESWLSVVYFLPYCTSAFLAL